MGDVGSLRSVSSARVEFSFLWHLCWSCRPWPAARKEAGFLLVLLMSLCLINQIVASGTWNKEAAGRCVWGGGVRGGGQGTGGGGGAGDGRVGGGDSGVAATGR